MGQGLLLLDDLDLFSSPHYPALSNFKVPRSTFFCLVSPHSPFKLQKLYLHFPDFADLLQKLRVDNINNYHIKKKKKKKKDVFFIFFFIK
jgi:hypothetical protein